MPERQVVMIDEIDSIHMIGVGGSGMSGIAKLLAQRGVAVSGSDLKPSDVVASLSGIGVETWIGHDPGRIGNVDVVVASSAVPDHDIEWRAAQAAGIPTARRPALLRGVTDAFTTIGFSGTHGKTTSTAMAVAALRACDRDPSFIVGGELTAQGSCADREAGSACLGHGVHPLGAVDAPGDDDRLVGGGAYGSNQLRHVTREAIREQIESVHSLEIG